MAEIPNYSVTQKLMAMSLWASVGALLMASAAFMGFDIFTYRTSLVQNLSTLGEIISLNTASAVVFNDKSAAAKSLASLEARTSILSAGIYTPYGQVFALWQRDAKTPRRVPPMPANRQETYRYHGQSVVLFHPMVLDGSLIGMVYLESDLRAIMERLRQYAGIAAAVLSFATIVAALISYKMGQKIAAPILLLTEAAKAVSQQKDYSVRAEGEGLGEIGVLIHTFNEMLTKIQLDGVEIRKLNESLEQKVNERTAQLTAANTELEAFSYSVSHDLRAPLRHIGGFTELLAKNPAISRDKTTSRYMTILIDSVRQMGALIDDLLSFSRMGRAEMLKTQINLTELVNEVIRDFRPQMEGRDIQWKRDPLPDVQGDPAMLRVVFVNLLSNAIKYSRGRKPAIIEIGAFPVSGEERIIFVRDNGAGFDMKYVSKLFGVFQRLHLATEFEGTGIGLATVRRIIHRHHGRVWAEGAVDQGATFYVALPFA